MKNSNLIICALVLFAFAISGCTGRPKVVRHTDAMLVDEEHSTVAAPSGYSLFWLAPDGYAYDPTAKGNEHIRACVLQAANTKEFPIFRRAHYDSMLARKGKSLLIISEPGQVGVKVLENGVAKYTFYHELADETNPCRYYDSLMESAADSVLSGQTNPANAEAEPESEEIEEVPEVEEEEIEEVPEVEEEAPEEGSTEEETPAEDPDFEEDSDTTSGNEPVADEFEENNRR